MADARKTLSILREEWESCTSCNLGVLREANRGRFVFGEGRTNGIMFIGEGPGKVEEEEGRSFIGPSGEILRGILKKLGIQDAYTTYLVACRSCSIATDDAGGTSRQIPVWAKSGVVGGMWGGVTSTISQRHDLISEPFQIVASATLNATRTQEGKVIRIWCR